MKGKNESKREERERERDYKPLSVPLKALLVENLNGNGEGFEANPDILVDVTLVDGAETAFAENIIGAEALGDSLELV